MPERNEIMNHKIFDTGLNALLSLENRVSDRVYTEFKVSNSFLSEANEINIFDNTFGIVQGNMGSSLVQEAAGFASGGNRVSVFLMHTCPFLQSGFTPETVPVPLVIYWITDHSSPDSATPHSDFIHFSVNSKEDLIPLALAAHKTTELTLCPVVLSVPKRTLARVPGHFSFPESTALKSFLKTPSAHLVCPTKAQRLMFGEERPIIPNIIDRNMALASGLKYKQGIPYISAVSRHIYITESLPEIVLNVFNMVQKHFQCSLSIIEFYRMEDAEYVFVTEGQVSASAKAVADFVAESRGMKLGVCALNQLNPFPAKELKKVLEMPKKTAIIGFALNDLKEIKPDNLYHFLLRTPSAPTLMLAAETLGHSEKKPGVFFLDCECPSHSDYPKRQVLLTRLNSEFPQLQTQLVPLKEMPSLKPENAETIAFTGFNLKEGDLISLTGHLKGAYITGFFENSARGHMKLKVTSSDVNHRVPGDLFAVNKYFTALNAASSLFFDELEKNSEVFFASPTPIEDFIKGLDPRWKTKVKEKNLKVYLFKESGQKLIEFAPKILNGDLDHSLLEEITDKMVTLPNYSRDFQTPPLIANAETGNQINNIPRFFGETLQPQNDEEPCFQTPEPALAFNVIPPLTGLFSQHNQGPDFLPEVFFQSSDFIGLPWLFCPEGAIGATSMKAEALFEFAADMGSPFLSIGKDVASKLKRSYKHLASQFQSELVKAKSCKFDMDILNQSFKWLLNKLGISIHDWPAYQDAFDCMCDGLKKLPIHVDPTFFSEQEHRQKGMGEFLLTFVNPGTCNGCGLCGKVSCQEGFIPVPFTKDKAAHYQELWSLFEKLPDTSGATIERMTPEIGELAAISLSKYTNFSIIGSGITGPGSGLRLAAKMLTSLCETTFQKFALMKTERLNQHIQVCHEKIHQSVSSALPVSNTKALMESLKKSKGARIPVAELLENLSASGQKGAVDADNLKGYAGFIEEMENHKNLIMYGNNGLGQSRYGVITTSQTLKDQISFPMNPFQVPFAVTHPDQASAMAEAFIKPYLRECARLQQIEKGIQNGPKTISNQTSLAWTDLSEEQKRMCPPILLFCGRTELQNTTLLQKALQTPYPVKLILLDEYSELSPSFAPALNALLMDDVFVGSTTLHDPIHLGRVFSGAINFSGPAFIHMYTPNPQAERIPVYSILDRCKSAVESWVHPLFFTDLKDPGVFGTRLNLDYSDLPLDAIHNPARWAFEHDDLKAHFNPLAQKDGYLEIHRWLEDPKPGVKCCLVDCEGQNWSISSRMADFAKTSMLRRKKLLEMTGFISPFTDRIREQLKEELMKAFEKQAAELEHEQKLALERIRKEEQSKISEKVTNQLLRLTGYMGAKK